MIRQLSPEETRELMRRGHLGHLACLVKNEPYIVPINYFFDGECAYLHSLPGEKIVAMRQNPRVCLQVDEIDSPYHWRSVQAFGRYEEIHDPNERAHFLRQLLNLFPSLTPVESSLAQEGYPLPMIVFRLRFDRFSGLSES